MTGLLPYHHLFFFPTNACLYYQACLSNRLQGCRSRTERCGQARRKSVSLFSSSLGAKPLCPAQIAVV